SVVAVDVGGTKLAAAVVGDDGAIRARATTPTPSSGPAEELFAALLAGGGGGGGGGARGGRGGEGRVGGSRRGPAARRGGGGGAGGGGCGGRMGAGGEAVSPLNIPAWRNSPLRARLEAAVGLPTFVDNDAKALALGEGWMGAAAGRRDYLAMVVSTGIGGGI